MSKLVLNICAVACLALTLGTGARADTLKIATLAPAGTSWMQAMQAGADRVRERSSGRVELKFYTGGVMGNDQSVHRKIRIGQLHGGAFTPGGLAVADSSIQSLGLPMLFKNLDEVDYVRARMDPVIKQQMKGKGFVILGITEGGFARILSKQPMQDLESLRAGKVWVPEGDRISQVVFKALGITPISLPIADVFTGLQTGLIDTVAVNPTSAIAFQWHSSTAYMTDLPITYLIGVLAVSERAFDRLSSDDQAILIEEMGEVFASMDAINRAENQAALAALRKQGITFVPPGEGEAERWRTIADEAIEEMVATGLIGAGVVDQVRDHLQAFRNRQ
jgi:TRAP-type C4-dicarboxylate transport system substrate-binding protein